MGRRNHVGFVRVSSREQEREGFSLDVQEDGILAYAEGRGGVVDKMFRVSETATRSEERKVFRQFLEYVKRHAAELDGALFYKIDRAVRNLSDYVELESLESERGVPFVSVTQPSENTPSGRMLRRTLATMASFTTEQQSLDVRDGLAKRVSEGLFPSRAPYGYRNVRIEKRGLVEVDEVAASNVHRVFELYTLHALRVEEIIDLLFSEGRFYSPSKPRFSEGKIYRILSDKSYLGKIWFRGEWHSGTHRPLITQAMFDSDQVLLGTKTYRSHQMVYAGQLIECGTCGRPVTGEPKTKETKSGTKTYLYYRCSRYSKADHPRIRLTEAKLDQQILELFEAMDQSCKAMAKVLALILRSRLENGLESTHVREKELKRQLSNCERRKDELLNLRIDGKLDDVQYEDKRTELESQMDVLRSQLDGQRKEVAAIEEFGRNAHKVFRVIVDHWPTATYQFKRRVLETVFGRLRLDGEKLVPARATPFEHLLRGGSRSA